MKVLRSAGLLACACSVSLAQSPVATSSQDQGALHPRKTYHQDVTETYGVYHQHDAGVQPDVGGSGAAWIDFDDDGDEDLYVLSFTGKSELYRYDGPGFTDVTAGSGLQPHDAIGVIVGDYDADGLDDMYVCTNADNHLYRNLGGGLFEDKAVDLGVTGDGIWSESASWADFDLDGDIDLYVGNYVEVFGFPDHVGFPNHLFRNEGPASIWPEIAVQAGVDTVYPMGPGGALTGGCTLVTNTLDHDEDGDPDLQVGNDFGEYVVPNLLYRNDTPAGGDIVFADISVETGFDIGQYCMGIKARDYDHDGDWDFYSTDIGPNALLRNDGGVFTDVVYDAGPVVGAAVRDFEILKISSWAVFWEDVNLDTWADLIVVNGHVPAGAVADNLKRVPNDLWLNQGDGTFVRVPDELSGIADEGAGRSLAHADINNDGALDLYITNNGTIYTSGPNDYNLLLLGTGLYGAGHWLELDLVGRSSHPNAFGAYVDAVLGDVVLKRQVLGDGSYLDSPSRVVHYGLGASHAADEVRIRWPSGIEQTLVEVEANQRMTVLEPAVTLEEVYAPTYGDGKLSLSARVRNRGELEETTTLQLELRLPDGKRVLAKSATAPLGAGAEAVVTLTKPLAPSAYAAYQGLAAISVARVSASGGQDHAKADVALP
ncbi:MAG: CRTAC1 family protein [Planctomycetota bacterium]